MLKWLIRWFNKIFKYPFGKKQTRSTQPTGEKTVLQPLPELTDADLEFLFTQLLEGVYQARGQLWAIKYLQRMENRISLERWIDWLLDFGERLLTSAAPNNQLAERMVQLGELGIGTIGELSYDIGIRVLTRNLGNPYWNTDRQDTETTIATARLTPIEEFVKNSQEEHLDNNSTQHAETRTPLDTSNFTPQKPTSNANDLVWEFTKPNTKITPTNYQTTPNGGEQVWLEQNQQTTSMEQSEDEPLQSTVAVTLDELLVRLEQSTNLVQQLASDLGIQSTEPSANTNLLNEQLYLTEERAQALFYEGLTAAKAGNLSEAIIYYNKAIEINPTSHEYWFNRGLTLFYLKYFTEALASYDRAIALKPDFYKCWYYRGGILGETGQYEDAIASFDKAIEIKLDYPEAWSSRGAALLKLGYQTEAVASFDQALVLQPEDQENWYYRGIALAYGERRNDAIASYDRALEIQPDFYEAWYNRGIELSNLERYEDAVASLEQATDIQPDFSDAWYALGSALEKLGEKEQAIVSYNRATELKPDAYEVWIDKGVVLASMGHWDEAISSWEQALEIQPDFYLAWFNCAVALENLERREDAIASYDKAVEINPSFYLAWYNRAVALFYTGKFEEAIASYDRALEIKIDYWEAWIGRGAAAGGAVQNDSRTIPTNIAAANPSLYTRGYEGKLASYQEGLKYVLQSTHAEGWGRLHLALGNAHYEKGRRDTVPRSYWQQAIIEYDRALKTLTADDFPQLHLEVVQNIVKTYIALEQPSEAEEFNQYAIALLQGYLNEPSRSDESKKQLGLRNIGFWQLAIDIAIQFGEIAQSLELAEYHKNACITWLISGWKEEIVSPSYRSIHDLLNPTTAIIYWHISPCTLRTFIIKYKSPEPIPVFTPVLNVEATEEMPLPEAINRLVEFEDWLEDWNRHEHEYRNPNPDTQNESHHSWLAAMEQRLFKLKSILNISAVINELEDITHLILIPHRDLHRFPLHALFQLSSPLEKFQQPTQSNFTLTYLPSVQVGLSLKSQPLWRVQSLPILSVENPDSANPTALAFAKLESEAIERMFHRSKCIQGLQATKKQVEKALTGDYNVFHFTGYVTDNFNQPQESELFLAGEDRLTIEEICQKNIAKYNLLTLSTCEIVMAGNSMITTEYVGLVNTLLNQGVDYVVSTLWTVESSATALVMIEFYRRLISDIPVATALLEATEWLRNVTAGELKKWYEETLNTLDREGTTIRANLATELYRSSKLPPDSKLYEHPFYWAAFTISGKFCS
ncbi:tetratricopeptide repeat protein [Scytonema sp. UIC 10036]|uniref:tetratricopeptide repeat protein n=1 Tax=Scytonema sp. UIC 10036 TaxID=2304196 RepID=UPI0012DA28C9|nr:tetratricopeptide repeat protein [Scytonema sp. UIC 10036]MUH01305.1 tetratricopeptide repeat protein [Scytonema sp. UIC 10036]